MTAFLLVLLILVALGSNEAVGYYFTHCEDRELMDCLMREVEADEAEEGDVVATGVYEYKGNSVTVTMTIPLGGGGVTGVVSGTCEGSFKGNYGDGALTGSMSGVCAPFFINIPASATFVGSVNKPAKTVPVTFTGRGGGITHEGAMVLTYP